MTTAIFASMAAVPMLAFSMPFLHGNVRGNANVDAKAKANVHLTNTGSVHNKIWEKMARKMTCLEVRLDLESKQRAELSAYLKAHPIKTRADFKAYAAFKKELKVKYKALQKTAKENCKKPTSSSSSSKSSTSSSVSSASSVPSSVSSNSSVSTSSSVNSSSSLSSILSSISSSLASSMSSSVSSQ